MPAREHLIVISSYARKIVSRIRKVASTGAGRKALSLHKKIDLLQESINRLQEDIDKKYNLDVYDIHRHIHRSASIETGAYVNKHFNGVPRYESRLEMLGAAAKQAKNQGLFMEFGVAAGNSINYLAEQMPDIEFHGFDSFEGLPEPWYLTVQKEAYSRKGKLPPVRHNVKLHKGLFSDVLPGFMASNPQEVSFIHIDCDLYSSTKYVLDELRPRLVPGTVIVFDEYFNYGGWKEHEFKAFQEFVSAHAIKYKYIGYTRSNFCAAVQIV